MVWPFTSYTPSESTKAKNADPYSKLDPSLRKFLDRESPASYDPSKPPERELTSREKVNIAPKPKQSTQPNQTDQLNRPAVPTSALPTLFPDGRYAHIWKNYRPQTAVDAETKTDQEKLDDVLQSFQDRKNAISAASLENCAAINVTLDECFRKPNLVQRTTLCRTETRALNRCLDMNKRFLRALGYMTAVGELEGDKEAIQMHADRLYTKMLAQEKEAEVARKEGREVPVLRLFEKQSDDLRILEQLTEHGKKALDERIKDLSPAEKDIEVRAFAAELKAGTETLDRLDRHREEVRQARKERLESGKARAFDRFQSWCGW